MMYYNTVLGIFGITPNMKFIHWQLPKKSARACGTATRALAADGLQASLGDGPQFLWFGIGKIRDLRLSNPCSFGYLSETFFTIHHIPAWIVFVRLIDSPNKTVAMKTVKHAFLGLVLAMFISTYSNQRSPTFNPKFVKPSQVKAKYHHHNLSKSMMSFW